ncbi:hypothetical protein [Candidatus Pelagibacter sp.]|uniref:hypothetical protein n=1 Tax=Candidatus Pelagibacter sp. TaxID=2024849 RepID=UPI003F86F597
MKKKIIISGSVIIFFFSLLVYYYFNLNNEKKLIEKKKKIELVKTEGIENNEEEIRSLNIIQDVSYSAKDTKGNEYFVKASEGTIDQNYDNFIFLKSVNATINLENYKLIEISSDFGKYNTDNYDTIFSKNVIIKYLDNIIKGGYLDFSWGKNLMIISKNVVLESNQSSLQADVIEVNIEKKDIKIFMYEENKKVNIKSLN